MSTNWKAGDKALCITDDWNRTVVINDGTPKKGTVYLVTQVMEGTNLNGFPDIGLFISGVRSFHKIKKFFIFTTTGGELSWSSQGFRKIVPACDRIAQQEEGLIPHEGFFEGRPDL